MADLGRHYQPLVETNVDVNNPTLAEKEASVAFLKIPQAYSWSEQFQIALAALEREVAKEEAEARGKLPSLSEIEKSLRAVKQHYMDSAHFYAAAEIVKIVREACKEGQQARSCAGALYLDVVAQHARLE